MSTHDQPPDHFVDANKKVGPTRIGVIYPTSSHIYDATKDHRQDCPVYVLDDGVPRWTAEEIAKAVQAVYGDWECESGVRAVVRHLQERDETSVVPPGDQQRVTRHGYDDGEHVITDHDHGDEHR